MKINLSNETLDLIAQDICKSFKMVEASKEICKTIGILVRVNLLLSIKGSEESGYTGCAIVGTLEQGDK